MMKSETILFLSNGYAEDTIACCIIEKLLEESLFLKIKVLPLVGKGIPYRKLSVKILGPCKKMPSDGFIAGDFFYLLKDLKDNWLKMYIQKVKALRAERSKAKLVICVGDIFLVLTAVLFIKRPIIFLPTAKSAYIREHYLVEKWLMRHFCRKVLARDKKTALSLRSSKINAVYFGNAMMDCVKITGEDFGIKDGEPTIGILPGSKKEAYDNLGTILDAVREISLQNWKKVNFLLALAPSLDVKKINTILLNKNQWVLKDTTLEERKRGIIAFLVSQNGPIIKIIQGKFGDVLNRSWVIIGLAGMGNEQAVGMGKPVITFPGKGPQITKRFLRIQQKLLGNATFIVENTGKAVAKKVCFFLSHPEKLNEIVRVGKERMGDSGASKRIVKLILEDLTKKQ